MMDYFSRSAIGPWLGLFCGAPLWYIAHELGLYFTYQNCHHPWIIPAIHLIALVGTLLAAALSWRSAPQGGIETSDHAGLFSAIVGTGAGTLFGIVIAWQGLATFFYLGCAR
jgi:hypothetical protein